MILFSSKRKVRKTARHMYKSTWNDLFRNDNYLRCDGDTSTKNRLVDSNSCCDVQTLQQADSNFYLSYLRSWCTSSCFVYTVKSLIKWVCRTYVKVYYNILYLNDRPIQPQCVSRNLIFFTALIQPFNRAVVNCSTDIMSISHVRNFKTSLYSGSIKTPVVTIHAGN